MNRGITNETHGTEPGPVQPLVRGLFKTLLDDFPTLLDDADLGNLMDFNYYKTALGLRIGNLALLRKQKEGRRVGDQDRYYCKVYGGKFYLCSQWWKDHHFYNAGSLLRFVTGLIERRTGAPGVSVLERHRAKLRDYVR